MSILIKGMEIPKSCFACNFRKVWDDGVQCLASKGLWMDYDGKHQACPLVPVPPHGDLIERDALAKHITVEWFCGNKRMNVPWRAVEDAPTIIPAEPREEEIT